jgi:hypothetical protein
VPHSRAVAARALRDAYRNGLTPADLLSDVSVLIEAKT